MAAIICLSQKLRPKPGVDFASAFPAGDGSPFVITKDIPGCPNRPEAVAFRQGTPLPGNQNLLIFKGISYGHSNCDPWSGFAFTICG